MRKTLVLVGLVLLFDLSANADNRFNDNSHELSNILRNFKKVLIIGASVSADYAAPSPGRYLAERAGIRPENLVIQAKNGKKSTFHMNWLEENYSRANFDTVIAVDLFFHDYKWKNSLSNAEKQHVRSYLDKLLETAEDVILGNVISLFGSSDSKRAINDFFNKLAAEDDRIHVIETDKLYDEIRSARGYHYNLNGQSFYVKKADAMSDIVHPNELGSQVIANLMIQKLLDKHQDIPSKTLDYFEIEAPQRFLFTGL